ncbi:MAG: TetR/AcrR family transcriptional regulator [Bacteroidales bacterium]|nr:TetR/AcrR family transcriptional regulator [Bacteroidales bacterium]
MTTEEQILVAARKVFVRKGMEGSRMQEIADEAGINKALLHYYFRSKEKLFEQIFKEGLGQLWPKVQVSIEESDGICEFVESFIGHYLDTIKELPYLPQFILHEINRDPSIIVSVIKGQGLPFPKVQALIDKDVAAGRIKPIQLEHLMVNMVSMVLFPVIGQPIIQAILFNNDSEKYANFLDERKSVVTSFVLQAIGSNTK